ncbi:uncharacterized protein B0P05DRAFT_579193 [Gilbertella persicaria]|uniref:uncharacterized protein n=1 Tax=Gilbertella persicaria TaxID=101096 RepID=UPI0022201706|nr:uncharacterized protein B0P05DRAFT_579193 [Gilbertella persicaria]KAI8079494.1 hypothetical protein B0P05DRAFT_579193 [Gilbertella persicaria]
MGFLLPLSVPKLKCLSRQHSDAIEQAVQLAIEHKSHLVISIESEEIKAHKDCMDAIWNTVQAFLGTIYVIQLQVAYVKQHPLFDCHVVFQDICGYSVDSEPDIDTVCILDTDPIEPLVFQRVAVGGTFDHLHAGHKILLTMTALLTQSSMVVGVTDDCMLTKKKHKEWIASTSERLLAVKKYMQSVRRDIQYDIVPITDPFGPTVTDPTIDALVVSKETLKGGDLVNNERDMRGYPPLELRMIDVISSNNASVEGQEMDVLKISSSWIREYIANHQ